MDGLIPSRKLIDADRDALQSENTMLRAENERLTRRCKQLETILVTQAELDAARCAAPI